MATYKHIRSATANKRPTTSIADGQLAINTNTASPGLFFKDSAGTGIVKVGPVHVGTTAPNSSPAGSSGNYVGEQWLDTSVSPAQMKVWNGSAWIGVVADELPVSKLQDGAARQLIQTDAAGTGVEWTSNIDVPGTLDVTGATTLDSTLTVPLGSAAAPTLRFTGDTNTGLYSPGADQVAISTNGTGRLFVDANGRFLVGTSTQQGTHYLQIQGSTTSSSYPGSIFLRRGLANASIGDGNQLGVIDFGNQDGGVGATISAEGDAQWGSNDYPGRLVFSTTADGASSPTERVRITSAGFLKASDSGTYFGATTAAHEFRTSSTNVAGIISHATSTSYADGLHYWLCGRSATSAYNFLVATSGYGGVADDEFKLTGDGNGLCDGSWTGGGADYAEYFEWSDGNIDAEDRRGISVVLDGDKIRPALAGEDPIGVISGNPSVVGDSAWNKWNEKYLRDEFGTYILEDYEVEDQDGNTVIQQRRKLNPAYDPDVEYTSREERPEWDCVGLMGKLRIRKGQPTGSRWIKMRDVSATVEEWLVR